MTSQPALLPELGRRIRDLRQGRHWTLRTLARESGLSERFLGDLERGKANVSLAALDRVAVALQLKLEDLFQSRRPDSRIEDLVARLSPRQRVRAEELLNDLLIPENRRGVALIGLRGAGKTTVGKLLTRRLSWNFVELDRRVEELAGLKLPDLFSLHGEDYFRTLEREALDLLCKGGDPMVLEAGGGIVTAPATFELLRQKFVTIWLKAEPDQHWNRVKEQGDRRPMEGHPAAMARLRELLRTRGPLYRQAAYQVDTSDVTVAAVVDSVEAIARRHFPD